MKIYNKYYGILEIFSEQGTGPHPILFDNRKERKNEGGPLGS